MRLNDIFSKKRIIASVAAIALVAPLSALAAPITGAIGFGGLFNPTGGTGTDLSDATGLDFGFSVVTTANGDFLPAIGQTATYSHIDFAPVIIPVTPLWTVIAGPITYNFNLTSLSLDFQSATEINLSGAGTIQATGYDDTPGLWTFTGQQGSILFSFSGISAADDNPNSVPEPMTLALLMSGLLGIRFTRRRKLG